jgi:hypothetical protein
MVSRVAARSLAILPVLALAACASSKTKNETAKRNEFGPTFRERMEITDKAIKGKDYSVRSAYEKQIPKGTSEKTSFFGTRNVSGLKMFSSTKNSYQAKAFSQADKKNHTELQTAREAKEQSKMAAQMFRTPDSRYESQVSHFESQTSHESGKTFARGNETFATRDNHAAAKALEKNKKPVIVDQDKPTYTEDDVKRLLNKS